MQISRFRSEYESLRFSFETQLGWIRNSWEPHSIISSHQQSRSSFIKVDSILNPTKCDCNVYQNDKFKQYYLFDFLFQLRIGKYSVSKSYLKFAISKINHISAEAKRSEELNVVEVITMNNLCHQYMKEEKHEKVFNLSDRALQIIEPQVIWRMFFWWSGSCKNQLLLLCLDVLEAARRKWRCSQRRCQVYQ